MQLRSRPAGSIGLCGGSYCRRPSSGCARVVDCLAERSELTPSRLFPSARHNCSREVEDEQQVKLDGAVEAGAGLQIRLDSGGSRGGLQIQLGSRTDSGGSKAGGNANFANVGILALLCTHKWNYCWTYEQRCN